MFDEIQNDYLTQTLVFLAGIELKKELTHLFLLSYMAIKKLTFSQIFTDSLIFNIIFRYIEKNFT